MNRRKLLIAAIVILIILIIIIVRNGTSEQDAPVTTEEIVTYNETETDNKSEEQETVDNSAEEITTEMQNMTDKNSILDQKEQTDQDFLLSEESEEPLVTTDELKDNKNGETLPEIIEPANNGNKFDPKISNANIFLEGDYDFCAISSAILDWMYKMNIEDSCEEIVVLDNNLHETNCYKLELKFDKNGSKIVEMSRYGKEYYIQTYVDDADVGFTEEP